MYEGRGSFFTDFSMIPSVCAASLSSGGASDLAGIDGTVFFLGKNSTFYGAFLPIDLALVDYAWDMAKSLTV